MTFQKDENLRRRFVYGCRLGSHPYRGAVKGGSEIVAGIAKRISRPLTVTLSSPGHHALQSQGFFIVEDSMQHLYVKGIRFLRFGILTCHTLYVRARNFRALAYLLAILCMCGYAFSETMHTHLPYSVCTEHANSTILHTLLPYSVCTRLAISTLWHTQLPYSVCVGTQLLHFGIRSYHTLYVQDKRFLHFCILACHILFSDVSRNIQIFP